VNNKWGRMWKKAFVALFEVVTERYGKTTRNLSQYSRSPRHALKCEISRTWIRSDVLGLSNCYSAFITYRKCGHRNRYSVCVCLCIHTFQLLNQSTNFHKFLYVIGGHPNYIIFNVPQLVITTWRTLEYM
jgi:hypothetical protein